MGRLKEKYNAIVHGISSKGIAPAFDNPHVGFSAAALPVNTHLAQTVDYGEKPRVLNRGNKHVACVLLLDTSGTMQGEPLEQLKRALETFRISQLSDPVANGCIDVCVVAFDDEARVLSPFCPLCDFVVPRLEAGGMTNLQSGISTAYAQIKKQMKVYGENGIDMAVPWILLLTDGMPNVGDTEEAIRFVKEKEGHLPKPRFFLYGIGTGNYDRQLMMRLCAPGRAWEATIESFSGMFDWVSQSFSQISRSPADMLLAPLPLPPGVKALPDR